MKLHEYSNNHIRLAIIAIILSVSLSSAYFIVLRITSHFFYYQAKKLLHTEKFGLAVNKLKNAEKYQPEDYNIRVVKFAPRKCVDVVEIDPAKIDSETHGTTASAINRTI